MIANRSEHGLTITELLIASVLVVLVAFGIVAVDSGRTQMHMEVLERSGLIAGQAEVGLAAVGIAERLATADRLNLNAGTGVYQFRVPVMQGPCAGGAPAPGCFDNPANYRWDQYRLNAGELRLYTNTGGGCGTMRVAARNVGALSFTYQDQAAAPPGGDGAVQDNNLVGYAATWDNGRLPPNNHTQVFQGWVASRAIPYSDVNTTATESGSGLSAGAVSPPPAPCP